MRVQRGSSAIVCISFALILTGCEKNIPITAEQYTQWTLAEQALNSAQRGDLLVLGSGRVCAVKENNKMRVHADCKDGSPNWKNKHDLAPYLAAIVTPSSPLYNFHASQYVNQ